MTDFLLELLSEEIPARMQEKASADLARLFEAELGKWGVKATVIESFVTPRRLALIARGLPEATEPVSEELKGPRADAPEQAISGFLAKAKMSREQLVERADAKGNVVLFAIREVPPISTVEVLSNVIFAIVHDFPWPKSMRWGAASKTMTSLRWVRPLQGIVALFGEQVVSINIDGIESGATTVGHRFHHPDVVTIGSAADYACKLRACHVIVDSEERRRIVREGAEAAAAAEGLVVVPDEGLVAENAGLTEWPVPLLGRFDPDFLSVPREVIQLTMRTNQKYFACTDGAGALAPAFICTANIVAADGGAAIVEGNAKVLAARLSDARFFWDQDLKVHLEDQAGKLYQIVFHEKLGTVADKVERVAKLARWLVEEGIVTPSAGSGSTPSPFVPSEVEGREAGAAQRVSTSLDTNGDRAVLADMAEQAARLAKADLVTGMVGEFPELQGVMGGYYARAEGLPDAVADAIRDHYKPVGQGDDVPTAPVTVAVSLADKLDTIAQFFSVDEKPTGSKDPFALRRAALGIVALATTSNLRFSTVLAAFVAVTPRLTSEKTEAQRAPLLAVLPALADLASRDSAEHLVRAVLAVVKDWPDLRKPDPEVFEKAIRVAADVRDFLLDRLEVSIRQSGSRIDILRSAQIVDGNRGKEDDLVRLLARVKALQAFVETEEGANLLAGYRRAANILRAEAKKGAAIGTFEGFVGYTPDAAEAKLAEVLDTQLPIAEAAIEAENFEGAMTALSVIRPAIDAFFDDVTVNSDDETKRSTRLALLEKLRAAMHKVADFSRIEG